MSVHGVGPFTGNPLSHPFILQTALCILITPLGLEFSALGLEFSAPGENKRVQ